MEIYLSAEENERLEKHAEHLGFESAKALAQFILEQTLHAPQFMGLMTMMAAKK
jgi:hypothetical protein